MKTKAVFPGQYVQGQGVLNDLPEIVNLFGSRGLLLTSQTGVNKILPAYENILNSENITVELFKGECCEDELERLIHIVKKEKIDVVIAMGGGKAIDTGKITADRACLPVIVVPTIASTDAPCSGCAVTYTPSGIFEAVHYQKRNPAVVLVDMDIIVKSPTRFIVAGMGDALATWFEARSCNRTQSLNECGALSTITALNLAKLCYDTILKYGVQAKIASESGVITPALNYITEANILLSGIGFESSGLAAAHSVHNGLTALDETHSFYHGEKVAFGVLTGLHLNSADPEEIEEVYSFCEKVGLPTTFKEVGINEINMDKLKTVAEKACEPGQYIHHEAGEITPEKVISAMIMADALGRERKTIE